jgi:hypothetical protein
MAGEEDGAATAAAEDTGAAEAVALDPVLEREAREMGWRPKDQFKGKPEEWRPADEFVKRGREVLPIVTAENKKLREKLAALEKSTADTIARIEKMSATALKTQRAEIEAKYDAQIDKAAEAGDTKAVKAARTAQRTALKEFDEAADETADAKAKPAGKDGPKLSARDQATLSDWMDENKWFSESRVLRAAADDAWDDVEKEMPGASMADKLEAIRERVAAEYPAKFGKKAAPKVEGAGDRGGGGGEAGGELWARVPKEARAQADRMIKTEGMFLGKGENKDALTPAQLKAARERYASEYLS